MKKGDIYTSDVKENYDFYKIDFIDQNWPAQKYEVTRYYYNVCQGDFEKFKSKALSKVDGTPLRFNGMRFNHSYEHSRILNGNATRGKKRPEHSIKLKNRPNLKNRKENWSDARHKYADNYFNSPQWRAGILNKKGINTDNLSSEDINELYSKFNSARKKSAPYKLACISHLLNNPKYAIHINEHTLKEIEKSINSNTLNEDHYKLYMSLKSSIAMNNHTNNMGGSCFPKTLHHKNNFSHYCGSKETFKTRSSWEEHYIALFESTSTPWEYEPVMIQCGDFRYTPDFRISINDVTYFLEVKGYFRDTDQLRKQTKKIRIASQQFKVIFIDKLIDSIGDLLYYINMQIFVKTHDNEESNNGLLELDCSREDVVKSLTPGDIFIHDGVYLYTSDAAFTNINSYLFIGGKCKSHLKYNIKDETHDFITTTLALRIVHEDDFSTQIEELKKLKEKKYGSKN